MSSDEKHILTRAGYEVLKKELDNLLHVDVPQMTEKVVRIRQESDHGEDQMFFEVMKEKTVLDERVAHLQRILREATIIDEDPDPDSASPGDRVTVRDIDTQEELDFDLLGSEEIAHGRHGVSIASPVGKALLGQKVGATIEVETPDGITRYIILKLGDILQAK